MKIIFLRGLAVFGLLEAKTAGKPIPGDVAYDKDGNLTTDPAEALAGAIRVFDRCVICVVKGRELV